MPGCFRLTKSKFQIFTIFSIIPIIPILSNSSKNFLFFQKFPFFQILPLFLNLISLAGGGVFWQDDRPPHQNFTALPNFDSRFQLRLELGMWQELERATPKILGFSKFWQVFSAGKGWDCFSFKLPKISKFWESWEFLSKWKKFEKLENSGGAEICRVRTNKPYIPKKGSFSPLLIRSGPAQILSFN